MPQKNQKSNPPVRKISISGIQHLVDSVQDRLTLWSRSNKRLTNKDLEQLSYEITRHIEIIQGKLKAKGASEKNLTANAVTALRWLSFINDPEKISRHVKSIAEARGCVEELTVPKRGLFRTAVPEIEIRYYNTRYLYKGIHNAQKVKILIHEAFIGAPSEITRDLIYLAMRRRDKKCLQNVRAYSSRKDFIQSYTILAAYKPQIKAPEGAYFDLREVFFNVNRHYFNNRLSEPNLGWSSRRSHKKFGHYQEETDTVVLSRTLDSPQIPAFVVDFVMYHELLHKDMGTKRVNGRRHAHTSAFRAAEKQFEFYDRAQAVLTDLANNR